MEEKPNIWKHSMNSGLMVGLVLIVFSLISYIAQLEQNRTLSFWVTVAILIGGIIWTHQQYKKNGDGSMKYSQGLGLGTLVSGVAAIINGIFGFIYLKFIDPSVMERAIRAMEEEQVKMQDQGMSEAQIETSAKFMEFFQNPIVLSLVGIITLLFFGFLISLIVTIFTKQEEDAIQP